jgi:hypothetical protein
VTGSISHTSQFGWMDEIYIYVYSTYTVMKFTVFCNVMLHGFIFKYIYKGKFISVQADTVGVLSLNGALLHLIWNDRKWKLRSAFL